MGENGEWEKKINGILEKTSPFLHFLLNSFVLLLSNR